MTDDLVIYTLKHLISVSNNTLDTFFPNIFGTPEHEYKKIPFKFKHTKIPLWNHFNAILTLCFPMNVNSSTTFTKLAGVVENLPLNIDIVFPPASAVPGASDSHYSGYTAGQYTPFDAAMAEMKNPTL